MAMQKSCSTAWPPPELPAAATARLGWPEATHTCLWTAGPPRGRVEGGLSLDAPDLSRGEVGRRRGCGGLRRHVVREKGGGVGRRAQNVDVAVAAIAISVRSC
uniref:Uncharacterized protein n=1 Tax=Tetraselmis chuii TaxID=63592 RepID=A0A7S1X139_9CHLO|mmetsp:Transcript_19855/g.35431  ORF Transcript_19855/g.35431 Transcript_19855/m.35431 type:complete len:103 (+) Transcript_19855:148-456(+)